jgi:hypothetical protein
MPDEVISLDSISRFQVGTEADTQYQGALQVLIDTPLPKGEWILGSTC